MPLYAAQSMEESQAHELVTAEQDRVAGLLRSVRSELAQETESLSEQPAIVEHQADLGSDTFERERTLSLLTTLEHELVEIEAALARIEDGTYGVCEVCGEAIASERLEAVPAARFCVVDELRR